MDGLLIMLIDMMIFLSPFPYVIRTALSTVPFFTQIDSELCACWMCSSNRHLLFLDSFKTTAWASQWLFSLSWNESRFKKSFFQFYLPLVIEKHIKCYQILENKISSTVKSIFTNICSNSFGYESIILFITRLKPHNFLIFIKN